MKGPRVREGGTEMRRYALIFLIAVELLMSFSFLGYFHIDPISITTAYIPVLLAGALTGPAEAAAVGTVFGLASMWKASASYVMAGGPALLPPPTAADPLGSMASSASAPGSSSAWRRGSCTRPCPAAAARPGVGVAAVSFLRAGPSTPCWSTAPWASSSRRAGYGPGRRLLSGFFKRPRTSLANLATAGAGAGASGAAGQLPGVDRGSGGGWRWLPVPGRPGSAPATGCP